MYTYDDSRVVQACAHFRREARAARVPRLAPRAHALHPQVFKEYAFTPHDGSARKCFSTSLSNLVDSLAVCAGSDGAADLCFKWPDQDGRLLLQCVPRRAVVHTPHARKTDAPRCAG